MTETHILVIGFVLTFGFLGYKLAGFVKKILDDYAKKISAKIDESELLKNNSVKLLDDAKKKEKNIENEIEKMKQSADKTILEIKEKFENETDKMITNFISNSEQRIKSDNEELIEDIKEKIKKHIEQTIEQIVNKNISQEQKDNSIAKIIAKIDFKKLLED